jgi:hypothetical protein
MSRSFLSKSSFFLVVWYTIKTRTEKQLLDLDGSLRELLKIEKHTDPQETGPDYSPATERALFEDCVRLWSQSSEQIWKGCRANEVAYYHFLQPNQYVAGSKPFNDWERRHILGGSENLSRKGVENGYPGLIASGRALRGEGLPFTDLTQLFADRTETLYRDNSCHFNDRGYELLARKIAQVIGG